MHPRADLRCRDRFATRSPTFRRHFALELNAANGAALFIPPGLAHGFQTLEDDCEVLYQMSDFYVAELAAGVRWNDPAFGIAWPLACSAIHERDAAFPDFDAQEHANDWFGVATAA